MEFEFELESGAKHKAFFGPGASRRFKRWSGYAVKEVDTKGEESDMGALAYFCIEVYNELHKVPKLETGVEEFIDRLTFQDLAVFGKKLEEAAGAIQKKSAATNRATRRKVAAKE